MENAACAWMGSLGLFLATPEEVILRDLSRSAREKGMPQLFAWDRSLIKLRKELSICLLIFVPPLENLDQAFEALIQAGAKPLGEV